MIHTVNSTQSGFSAVELLITLFIAAAFIITGTQLYTVIIANSEETRLRSVANNIAYENMRKYTVQASGACATYNQTPAVPASSGLPNASMTVNISCPYGVANATSKLLVTLQYGTPQQEVAHAIFVTN